MVQSVDTLRHARICHNENRQEISFSSRLDYNVNYLFSIQQEKN